MTTCLEKIDKVNTFGDEVPCYTPHPSYFVDVLSNVSLCVIGPCKVGIRSSRSSGI